MNNEFDFNIKNYTIDELESFLKLDENYNLNDINEKCSRINSIINENRDYDKVYKTKLGIFLDEAKIKLVKHIKEISKGNDGFIEDYDKLLIDHDHDKIINQTSTTHVGSRYIINPETISFNDIIDKNKHLEPIEAYPTNISRSNLNNLKRKTVLQTIVLNTLFREDYFGTNSTDFTIVLPYYFKNVLSLRLSSLQLPNVIYCISKSNGNNTFFIEEEITGISGTITFPDGNYLDINDFCILLQNEINTQLGISPDRFIVSCDQNSGKITISNNTNNFILIFNTKIETVYLKCKTKIIPKTKENIKNCGNFGEIYRKFTPTEGQREQNCVNLEEIYKKFGWIIGYRDEVYSSSNSYTTEAVYNGAYPNYIYFVLNDFNNSQAQNVFGMYSKSIIGDNILGMIPITSQSFYVNFTNGNDFIERKREYFGPVRIQRLKVQLLNQYGDVINLNNMDYSFSLELEIGYDI
jgi:hypothetical protein